MNLDDVHAMPRPAPLAALALAFASIATPARAGLTLDGLTGPVTAAEIASFKATMAATAPLSTGGGNWMSDGDDGRDLEAFGQMYEITGDVAFLDRMIDFIEPILAARNDPKTGRVMWTGLRDLVWITKDATVFNAGYAGSEQGDALGHIAYAANLILRTPALWSVIVPDGNPHGWGVTYLDRAKAFVSECEKTEDSYLVKWFVDPTTHRFTPPALATWTAMDENVTAWNRQMMFDEAFLRLADAHALLGDAPDKVTSYRLIAKTSVEWFLSEVHANKTAYSWSYGPSEYPKDIEYNEGIHAVYDIIGLWNAYASCALGITTDQLKPFASTAVDVLSLGPGTNQFHSYVDGTGPILKDMWDAGWVYLTAADARVFETVAGAAVAAGRATSKMDDFAAILWVKNAIDKKSFPSCAATGATGDAGIPPTDGGAVLDAGAGPDSSTASGDAGGIVDAAAPESDAAIVARDSGTAATTDATGGCDVSNRSSRGNSAWLVVASALGFARRRARS
ncbi:MAG: hypothetical protein ACHREM_06725 [Polyangiales bacterium]